MQYDNPVAGGHALAMLSVLAAIIKTLPDRELFLELLDLEESVTMATLLARARSDVSIEVFRDTLEAVRLASEP